MYSVNVSVPPAVRRIAADFAPRLTPFEDIRDHHSLLVKRFRETDRHMLRERLRTAMRGTERFEVTVGDVGYYERPPRGPGPVVYLEVESEELRALHERLVDTFGAFDGFEGEDYSPHVTLARGGDNLDAADLAGTRVEPVTWTVRALDLYDGSRREAVGKISLPA